jgi:L-2-hydroxyglutarate oxidase LhgO
MERANVVIIGGGIVGLAIAAKLSENVEGVIVLEKNKRIGQEVSSHNSGVIHSGIHYPKNSLKARLCVLGNGMLYEICKTNGIPYKKLGKLTVAIGESEIKEIERLRKQGEENGVEGLSILEEEEISKVEPNVVANRALLSPSTGIVEPDDLLNYFQARATANGASIALDTNVTGLRKEDSGYEVRGIGAGSRFSFQAESVINSAGLYSDRIAAMVGLDIDRLEYRLHYCKGDYFRISGYRPVRHLVYPVPKGPGLGIHLTPDSSGSVKLGPNAYYVADIDYRVSSKAEEFRADVMRFVPSLADKQILEDSSGIRPKLQGPNDSFKDFIIREEGDLGFPGFIDLIGIESPGLTASPAIGEYVAEIYSKLRR